MKVLINGCQVVVPVQSTLQDALQTQKIAQSVFAVVLNSKLVPRAYYPHTPLEANDEIDIIVPMQGG
jgi:sulfur carrier protein